MDCITVYNYLVYHEIRAKFEKKSKNYTFGYCNLEFYKACVQTCNFDFCIEHKAKRGLTLIKEIKITWHPLTTNFS